MHPLFFMDEMRFWKILWDFWWNMWVTRGRYESLMFIIMTKLLRPQGGVFTIFFHKKQLSPKMCIIPCSMTWHIDICPTFVKNFDFGPFLAQNTAMENIWKIINWQFTGQVIVKFIFWCHNQLRLGHKWGYRAQNYGSI